MSLIFVLPGLLTLGPLHLLNKILAERERIRALKKSQVKIYGADVMGSTKIVTSFMLYPLLCIFWTLLLFVVQLYFGGLAFSASLVNCIWFVIFFPLYSYICVRSIDGVADNYNNLAIRIYALISSNTIESLLAQRALLAKKVHEIIDKYGPEVFENFDKMKLVKGLKAKKAKMRKHSNDSDVSSQSSMISSMIVDQFDFDTAFETLSEIGL